MISPRGGYEILGFEFANETQVHASCSLQWQNQLYVFGGSKAKKQVLIVNGNRLEKNATLDFDFTFGGCTVLNQSTIVLCFHHYESQVCRQSNSPLGLFKKLPDSNHMHFHARIASLDGKNNKTIY